jgi:hypothetical protein
MAYDANATRTHIYVSGAIIYAANHNDNENTIYSKHNGAFHETTGHTHTGAVGDGPLLPYVPPVGSIVAWDDYGGALSFSTTYWEYCDGTLVSSATSPIFGLAKRDMSNRYIVGYGTEGGGDIGTAPYDATPWGNASHQINIQHNHSATTTVNNENAHTHSVNIANFTSAAGTAHLHAIGTMAVNPASTAVTGTSGTEATHVHTVNPPSTGLSGTLTNESSHTHTSGTLYARIAGHPTIGGIYWDSYTASWTPDHKSYWDASYYGNVAATNAMTYGAVVSGSTAAGTSHTHATSGLSVDIASFNSGAPTTAHSHGAGSYVVDIASTAVSGAMSTESAHTHQVDPPATTSAAGSAHTHTASTTTGNALSATQSIQPRSMKLRYLIRVL